MSTLVTGSEGFVGKRLCTELKRQGYEVYGLDTKGGADFQVSVTDSYYLKNLMKKKWFHTVFHLAAKAIVRDIHKDPYEGFNVNIMGTLSILEAARLNDVGSVIVASSDKAYGENEVPYTEGLPLLGSYPYDVSKACADMLARSYYKTYGLKTCVTRCSNIYGPGDLNFSRLIPYTIKCLVKGETPKFHAEVGDIFREYTYVDDVVDAYILLAERINDVKGEAFNIGSGFKATRDEVMSKISKLMGKEISFELVPADFKEIRNQYLSSEKIRLLGWQQKVDFDEGLKRTISWYKEFLK